MAVQKGDNVILKIGDGVTPTEGFVAVGGLRNVEIILNNRMIETDSLTSGAWRMLLPSAGIRRLSVRGQGVFTDAASEETLRGYAFAGSCKHYELHFGNGDKVSGLFLVSEYQGTGEMRKAEECVVRLESAGAVSFQAG